MDDITNEKTEISKVEITMGMMDDEIKSEETTSLTVEEEVQEPDSPKEENKGKRKCIFKTIAWVIVILAIAGLYVLHFTQPKTAAKSMPARTTGESKAMIVTVNTDSIMEHFTLVKILQKDLEDESERYDKDFESKEKSFTTKYQNFTDNVQNNRITQTQAENAQRQLGQEYEQLEMLKMQYSTILQNKSISVQTEIMDSTKNAANRVNLQLYQADYVFAVSSISAILYANDVYDITNEVIKELNDSYKKSTK